MANPLTAFIDLTDQFGTRVSALAVDFTGGVTSLLWRMGAELITTLVQLALVFAIFILDLIVNQGLFLEIAGSMYQVVLDYIYSYVSPQFIAICAFAILLARIYIGDKITVNEKTGRITKYELNYTNLSLLAPQEKTPEESFRKKVVSQLGTTVLLLAVIIVAMANPFVLLTKIFGLITEFVTMIAPDGIGANVQIDGILVPVLHLINYQGQLAPACNRAWSTTLAAGGDVAELACLTPDQQDAATAGVVTFVISLASILLVGGFVYFTWVILCRFSWMLFRMITHIAVLPWHAALLIGNPGNERKKLDTVSDHVKDAATSLFWLLLTVFVAQIIPAAVFNAMGTAADRWQLPAILQLLIASAVLFGCGKAANYYIGRKWKKNPDGSTAPVTDGTTGWNDFFTNGRGKVVTDAFAQANKDSAKELALSAAEIAGTQPAAQNGAQEGRTVDSGNGVVNDPDMDAATRTAAVSTPLPTVQHLMVTARPDATPTLTPHGDSVAGGPGQGVPGGDDEVGRDGQGGQTAAAIAAAATAAVLAAGEQTEPHPLTASDFTTAAGGTGGTGGVGGTGGMGGAGAVVPTPEDSTAPPAPHPEGHGGYPHTEDPATAAQASADPVPADPAAARRDNLSKYQDIVGGLAEDPDAVSQVPVTTSESPDSPAFARITETYSAPATTGDNPVGSGVTGGTGQFVSCTQRHREWQETRTLALVLGMRAEPVPEDDQEKQPEILFYAPSSDGNNQVRFRRRNGFGDVI